MSRLTDLLRQVRKADAQLGADLEAEFRAFTSRRTFGLVFERHVPEEVELPQRPVRKGDKVHVLPPRGQTTRGDQRLWSVVRFENGEGSRKAHLVELGTDAPQSRIEPVENLVLVAEFRDPIYPGLVETGRKERGGDKPFHSVINAENYHALELLTYTHRARVDAIYIDPPYNSGARDWTYNNRYVESDDLYRHSKWLAFMERRLLLARELLNPENSVLIVTIDEKEYLRLGLLIEQTFPEARIQMISDRVNPANVARRGAFGRNDEYIFIVMFGSASPQPMRLGPEWVSDKGRTFTGSVRWDLLRRSGTNARRIDRLKLFYPIFAETATRRVVGTGEWLPEDQEMNSVDVPSGATAIWPIRKDGSQGNWQLGQTALMKHVKEGRVRLGGSPDKGFVVYYIKGGEYRKILGGEYPVIGRNTDGSLDVGDTVATGNLVVPGTQWRIPSHDATQYGSRLLRLILPDRDFPFPKSLYSVEDVLRFFIHGKPEATILDFFAGSGTTAHAVMRLNRQDGGRRQCISVTNNEVGAARHAALGKEGRRPGDPEWEQWGICDYITKPRIEAAITGCTPDGVRINRDYKFIDEFPMSDGLEENAVFFTLTYEGPLPVAHHRSFGRVAPILWLRAGARGEIITTIGDDGWAISETYGVLVNLDAASGFVREVVDSETVTMAYIVTDDDLVFQMVCRDLPLRVTPVQLYESYLQNFELNSGRLG